MGTIEMGVFVLLLITVGVVAYKRHSAATALVGLVAVMLAGMIVMVAV